MTAPRRAIYIRRTPLLIAIFYDITRARGRTAGHIAAPRLPGGDDVLKELKASCLLACLTLPGLALPGLALGQTGGPGLASDPSETAGSGAVVAEATAETAALEAAEEDEGADRFPLGASVTLSHRFDHGQFVDSNFDIGYQIMSLGVVVHYTVVEDLDLIANLSASKALESSFSRSGTPSQTTRNPTQLSDLSLGANWAFVTIPVAEIGLSLGGELRLPTSKLSQADGLIVGGTLSLDVQRKFGRFSLGVSAGYTHNAYENATQQIDPDIAPETIIISGRDLGNPLSLQGFSVALLLGYSIIDGLNLSASYGINNSYGSVIFERDAFTSEYAQDGLQAGTGAQLFSAAIAYTLPFGTGTSISASMTTASLFYTDDQSEWRLPFFDTESNTHERTTYGVTLAQAL